MAESAVPGREFIGEPLTEFGCVTGNWGCRMSPPEPELMVRCGGRRGAPDAVDTSIEDRGADDPGRGVFAPVDGLRWSPGVIGRSGMPSDVLSFIL